MLKIAILGGKGQLGKAISRLSADSPHRYVAYDEHEANILDGDALRGALTDFDIAINCAAYTNVEAAENNEESATNINVRGVAILSDICTELGIKLIHISTDYVFGGNSEHNTPYSEEECTAPINIYGKSKAEGEREALRNSDAVVIRTAWLYAPWSKNFCRTIYSLSATESEISVVDDQRGTPTSALSLARFIIEIIDNGRCKEMHGIYHYTDSGECSWYDFAQEIVKLAGHNCEVRPCKSNERTTIAKRPHYSVLSKTKVVNETGTTLRPWQKALGEVIEEIMNKRNILITGGAGFIGSHVARLFATKYPHYNIVILDKLTYAGNRENISDILPLENVVFIEGDITDRMLVDEIFVKHSIDGVLHLAAESHVDRSISAPMVFAHNNIIGTITLLEAARKAWSNSYEGKRFHHISTDEVYGALSLDGGAFSETNRYEPHSPYSASKASSDHFVRAYHDTYGLPTIITNCSNNYGEYQYPEKLIPLFIYNIVNRRPLPVYGTGGNVRDWLYVGDHALALDKVFHEGKCGDTYNIGGNNEWTNIDLVHRLIEIVDEELGHEAGKSLELITYVEDRAGHDLRYAIDSSKLKRELCWQPQMSFDEGLRRTVRWYLANTEWAERSLAKE